MHEVCARVQTPTDQFSEIGPSNWTEVFAAAAAPLFRGAFVVPSNVLERAYHSCWRDVHIHFFHCRNSKPRVRTTVGNAWGLVESPLKDVRQNLTREPFFRRAVEANRQF